MVQMADTSYWLSALLPIFLTISFWHILVLVSHFGQLACSVLAKLILGRFCDAMLPSFFSSRFPACDDYLNVFFTDPWANWEVGQSRKPQLWRLSP